MSKKNYIDGSLKLDKHAIQQKKLYRVNTSKHGKLFNQFPTRKVKSK